MLPITPHNQHQAGRLPARHSLQFASPPARVDEFKESQYENHHEVKYSDVLAAQASEKKDGLSLRKIGQLLTVGLALGSSFAGTPAFAATPPAVELVTQQAPQVELTTLAQEVPQVELTAIQKVAREAKFQPLFESLPEEFAEHMTGLDDAQMKVLGGGINRKTPAGPFKISNRKAFIRGHFMGHDIWEPMHKSVEKVSDFEQFQLPQESREELHQAVDMMKNLSRDQRRGLAEVMDVINDISG